MADPFRLNLNWEAGSCEWNEAFSAHRCVTVIFNDFILVLAVCLGPTQVSQSSRGYIL